MACDHLDVVDYYEGYGVNPKTMAKWKSRKSVSDLRTGPKEPR
jgi:hypothetical protein